MNAGKILKISIGLTVTALLLPYLFNTDAGLCNSNVQLAGEIPEPAGALLITLGGIIIYRRKRKNHHDP